MKSRMSIFTNELEQKEEEVEVLEETVKQLKLKKGLPMEEGKADEDGWQIDSEDQQDGWEVDDLGLEDERDVPDGDDSEAKHNETEETAKLKVAARRAVNSKKKIEEELKTLNEQFDQTKTQLDE